MTADDRQRLKAQIVADLDAARQEVTNLEAVTKPIAPENAIGRISRMDAINNKSINEAALRAARKKIPMLERALARIDTADYGTCARCKQPIPIGRLVLMPHTTRCVHCAGR